MFLKLTRGKGLEISDYDYSFLTSPIWDNDRESCAERTRIFLENDLRLKLRPGNCNYPKREDTEQVLREILANG
jgi:hypothetical protein